MSAEPDIRGGADGEADHHWLDPSLLRELAGWEPRVTLEEGLRLTLEWYRSHPACVVA